MESKMRRLVSGAGVIALAAAGLLGSAGMATADVGPGQDGAPGNGTLVIHKHAGSTLPEVPHDGTEQTIDRPVLGGVEFTVTPVGKLAGGVCTPLDLSTTAGWTDARAAMPAGGSIAAGWAPASPYCLATADAQVQTTAAATGVASFGGLDLGLYHVSETAKPSSVTSSVDFLVTLPYANTTAQGTDWLYTVHTYPKNTITGSGDKTVGEPVDNGLGTTLPWTITTLPLGTFDDGKKLTSYKIVDTLDARLTYTATPAPVVQYTVPGGTATDVPAANYGIVAPAAAGGTLEVVFTGPGVTWANTLPAGTYFTFTFSTTVTGVGDGSIENTGFQNSGNGNVTLGDTYTLWGPAEILKHQAGDSTKGLMGAKFSVYNSVDGACPANGLGAALSVNGVTEFESGANGIVAIPGLYVGNENNGITTRVYCVVETQAPAGFVRDATPRPITVKAETTATTTAHIDVANTPVTGPELPLTGSNGTLWFTIGGIALVVIAAGGVLMTRRSRVEN